MMPSYDYGLRRQKNTDALERCAEALERIADKLEGNIKVVHPK